MGRTTIYTLLFIVPIIVLLVTVNLYSKSALDEKSPKQHNTDNKVPDVIKHKVKSGDNLTSLAYMYRTTIKDIKDLNKLKRNNIYLGEVLNIPYNTEDFKGEESYIKYKAYKGDSLSVLASKFRTDIDSIKGINNLNNNQINHGQRLNIPYGIRIDTNEIDFYKTQKSDEIVAIEGSTEDKHLNILYNNPDLIDTEDIYGSFENQDVSTYEMSEPNSKNSLKYNNLESNLRNDLMDNKYSVAYHESVKSNHNDMNSTLKKDSNKYNQEIALDQEADVKVLEAKDNLEYIVKRGDNLSSIAEKYHATATELKELNKLNTTTLKIGQKISVPKHDFIRYRIQRDDNLSTIAIKYNTTLKELKRINDMKSEEIYIGQRIKIPHSDYKDVTNIVKMETDRSSDSESNTEANLTANNISDKSEIDAKSDEIANLKEDMLPEQFDSKVEMNVGEVIKQSELQTDKDNIQINIESFANNTTPDNVESVELAESKKHNNDSTLDQNTGKEPDQTVLASVKGKTVKPNDLDVKQQLNSKKDISKQEISEVAKNEKPANIEIKTFQSIAEDSKLKEQTFGNEKNIGKGDIQKTVSDNNTRQTHKVTSGDNLSTLALRYNTTVKEIKLANNLSDNQINIGQILTIPSSQKSKSLYVSNIVTTTDNNVDTKSEEIANLKEDMLPEQFDSKVEMNVGEVIKQSELQTDKDNIQINIESFANNTTPDNVESAELAESKKHNNDSTLDQNTGKEPDQTVVASVKDKTVKPNDLVGQQPENNDKLNQQVPQTAIGDQGQNVKEINSEDESKNTEVALKSDVKIQNVERSDSKELKENNFDVPDNISDGTDLNSPGDITKRKKSSISDLEFKHEDNESDLKNKVTLAQLLTLEDSTVQKEQDRYHALVEEQDIIARNDYNDIYAQKSSETTKSVETTESGEEIVNFPGEIDLRDLVRTMSEITNESFIIDDKLQSKKVTIITPKGGFSKNNAIRLFEAILDLNGFTVYRNGPINIVTEKRDIKSVPLPIQEGISIGSLSERFITQIVPLKNINAQDVANTLKPLVSREGDIVVYDPLNTLIIVETKTNLNKILIILNNIDKEKDVIFVKIYNSEASDISAMLTEIFGGTTASPVTSADQGDSRTRRRATTTRRAARTQQSSSGGQVDISGFKIITDDRTNSLIVIAYPEDIPKIKAAIERLDVLVDQPEHGIYVIKLKNADAEQIVNVLNSLISGTQITAQRSGERSTGAARTNQAAGASATSSASLTEFEIEDVRITADIATNSVIIVGSRREFESISRVVDELDIRRKQVYVEAAIMEVALEQLKSLGTNLSLGFTFNDDNLGFGGTNLPGVPSLLGAAADAQNAVTAVGSLSGMFLGVIGEEVDPDGSGPIPPIPSFTALFQALASITDVNILSTPSIVTTDNEEAEILVADVIPFPTGSTVGDSGVTVSTIDREPVGIRLTITPQIGDGDYLNLQLQTEVSNVRPSPPDLNTEEFGITTATRSATSNVVVKNGQTIVIGGLVQDRENRVENKVPALGDIPVLGNFFKFTSKSSQKINLMILLTPRIVEDQEDIKLILEDRQKRNMLLQDRNIDEQRLLLE